MSDNDSRAFWACLVCSQVWIVQPGGLSLFGWAVWTLVCLYLLIRKR